MGYLLVRQIRVQPLLPPGVSGQRDYTSEAKVVVILFA